MNSRGTSDEIERRGLHSVVGASDLSDGSDSALQAAAYLAASEATRLHVFHCVAAPVPPYWKGAVDDRTRESWLRDARAELERQCAGLLSGGDPAPEITVGFGSPSTEISRFARDVAANVIVLGPHSPRVTFDDLLGTTVDRVLRTSGTPCLLAHRPLDTPMATVLVGTDFSTRARRALETIVDWLAGPLRNASPDDATVEILHVSAFASRRVKPGNVHRLLEQEVDAARLRLPDPSPITIRSRILSAPLESEGIARACEQLEPDLIVLGTHGYGFLARALLGSTASNVARTIRYPLLMVPLAEPASQG